MSYAGCGEKKIQYINNVVNDTYIGKTCALYYQSNKEIYEILKWIDGSPKNERIWDKWKEIIDMNRLFYIRRIT